MARTDWNWWTNGSWDTSTAYKVSSTRSLMGVAGDSRFLYGASTFTNSRIYAQVMDRYGIWFQNFSFLGRWSQLNPIANGYQIKVASNPSPNYLNIAFLRWNAGVGTALATTTISLTPTKNTWIPLRFSMTTELGIEITKLERWTGTSWVTLYEYMDSSGSKISAAGYSGFAFNGGYGLIFCDDVKVMGLTVV